MMTGFERYTKKTRRAQFLEEMEQVVPWRELCALIEPDYPKAGKGRPPVGVERMLRIYFLQQWFNLSDPAVEETLYDSAALREFVGIDLGCEPAPEETTVCKFRHLLEEHGLGEQMLGTVNLYLQAKGVRITTGTIVDATIIHAPSSTKNREQQRDPEMHQTKKGQQWYFGMKAHVGVDSKHKIIHTVVATAANVADAAVLPDLLHGEETRVWGDGAYQGQTEVIHECAPRARDCTQRRCRYQGPDRRSGVGEEPDEVESAGQGGARVWGDEAAVRIRQGALPRIKEERESVVCGVRAGEPVPDAQATAAHRGSLAGNQHPLALATPFSPSETSSTDGTLQSLGGISKFSYLFRVSLEQFGFASRRWACALGSISNRCQAESGWRLWTISTL